MNVHENARLTFAARVLLVQLAALEDALPAAPLQVRAARGRARGRGHVAA